MWPNIWNFYFGIQPAVYLCIQPSSWLCSTYFFNLPKLSPALLLTQLNPLSLSLSKPHLTPITSLFYPCDVASYRFSHRWNLPIQSSLSSQSNPIQPTIQPPIQSLPFIIQISPISTWFSTVWSLFIPTFAPPTGILLFVQLLNFTFLVFNSIFRVFEYAFTKPVSFVQYFFSFNFFYSVYVDFYIHLVSFIFFLLISLWYYNFFLTFISLSFFILYSFLLHSFCLVSLSFVLCFVFLSNFHYI